jgi:signal transduction histidine kinase
MPPSTALRNSPAKATKAELEALGLGDPKLSLHQAVLRDFYLVAAVSVLAYIAALVLDLGNLFLTFTATHETLDEIFMAALFGLAALCWVSWRQWRRYSEEITRRIKLEEDIVEMRAVADHLGQNKSAFLADLGHDLRTPLNGILGFAQLLEEEPFGPIGNERYKSYVASIRESAAMLGDRTTTCLDPDKVEFGAEPLQMKPWPVHELVSSAMSIVETVAQSASIKIETDAASDLPDLIADRRAIKKILINLLANAIKFNRPGGLIRIAAKLTDDGALAIVVKDNGIGITVDEMDPRWTHPGQGETRSDAAPLHGMGIGLSAAKSLLDLHSATLKIRSISGKGTTVTMTFPRDRLIESNRPVERDGTMHAAE